MPRTPENTARPYYLSEFIPLLEEIKAKEGDLEVWVRITEAGYDDNIVLKGPVCNEPTVTKRHSIERFWGEDNPKVIVIENY